MSPDEYCQHKATQSGFELYYSFLLSAPERRRAITALYAFCREVDDAVGRPSDPSAARATLCVVARRGRLLFAGNRSIRDARARPAIEPFGITKAQMSEIMDGMKGFESEPLLNFAGLQLYCHRVAGVGRALAAGIFGYRNRGRGSTPKSSDSRSSSPTSSATSARMRGKKPHLSALDELKEYGVTAADILNANHTESFVRLMRFQAERARRCYDEALEILPAEDRRAQRPGLMMAAIYRALLDEIAGDDTGSSAAHGAAEPTRSHNLICGDRGPVSARALLEDPVIVAGDFVEQRAIDRSHHQAGALRAAVFGREDLERLVVAAPGTLGLEAHQAHEALGVIRVQNIRRRHSVFLQLVEGQIDAVFPRILADVADDVGELERESELFGVLPRPRVAVAENAGRRAPTTPATRWQ